METLARVVLPVQANWAGAGIVTDSARNYELRQVLIRAQQDALAGLDGNYPAHMKASWRIRLADQSEWEWNPQMGVPKEATHLVFVVAGE